MEAQELRCHRPLDPRHEGVEVSAQQRHPADHVGPFEDLVSDTQKLPDRMVAEEVVFTSVIEPGLQNAAFGRSRPLLPLQQIT